MKKCFILTVSLLLLYACSSEPYVPAKIRLSGNDKKVWKLDKVLIDLATVSIPSDTSDESITNSGFVNICCGGDSEIEIGFSEFYSTCNIDDQLGLYADSSFIFTEGDSVCFPGDMPYDTIYTGKWSFNDLETTIQFNVNSDPYNFFNDIPFTNEFIIRNLSESNLQVEYFYTRESSTNNIFKFLIPDLEGGERLILSFNKI